jgi:excisionase family DNA binding protein
VHHAASSIEALTIPEVMAALRLSRSKVYDLIRSGEIRSFTTGRARRVPAAEIPAYIHKCMEDNA